MVMKMDVPALFSNAHAAALQRRRVCRGEEEEEEKEEGSGGVRRREYERRGGGEERGGVGRGEMRGEKRRREEEKNGKAAAAVVDGKHEEEEEEEEGEGGFAALGVRPVVVSSLARLGIRTPTPVQLHCIPKALRGADVVAVSTTGSGKTAAFAIPIVDALVGEPYGVMAVILEPTRELAVQVHEQFIALAAGAGLTSFRCAVCCGGYDMGRMCKEVEARPHVVAATPGRLRAVMDSSSGHNGGGNNNGTTTRLRLCFKRVRVLVLDEADRLLEEEFEDDMLNIIQALPAGGGGNAGNASKVVHGGGSGVIMRRQTMLFSATRTRRVDQIRAVVASKDTFVFEEGAGNSRGDYEAVMREKMIRTVEGLTQEYVFVPDRVKEVYLVSLLDDLADPDASTNARRGGGAGAGGGGSAQGGYMSGPRRPVRSVIIFCSTCRRAQLLAYLLRALTSGKPSGAGGSSGGGGGSRKAGGGGGGGGGTSDIDGKRMKSNAKNAITVLHSRLNQRERTASLTSFKSLPSSDARGAPSAVAAAAAARALPAAARAQARAQQDQMHVLIATDVASRGLDIPHVDVVVHYDVPKDVYDYVHRSGRTARAGRKGRCVSLVTQYDIERVRDIEEGIGMKLSSLEMEEKEVLKGMTRVLKARRAAALLLDENPLREKR